MTGFSKLASARSAPDRYSLTAPALRVRALFRHATRYGGVAPVEREVDPHPLLDDRVVLPAVEHDIAPYYHAPQLLGIRDRGTLRPQRIVSATLRVQ